MREPRFGTTVLDNVAEREAPTALGVGKTPTHACDGVPVSHDWRVVKVQ